MKYCPNCGTELKNNIKFCPNCGKKIDGSSQAMSSSYSNTSQQKSKIGAGLLGILLGSLGIHNFYLGYTSKAVCQLLLSLVGWLACGLGPIIAGTWGLVEGILILTGSINKDADGNPLQD